MGHLDYKLQELPAPLIPRTAALTWLTGDDHMEDPDNICVEYHCKLLNVNKLTNHDNFAVGSGNRMMCCLC